MPPRPGDDNADDPSIPDDARILRRIPPGGVAKNDLTGRPQSGNFDNSQDGTGTSVRISSPKSDPFDLLKGHENFGLVEILVKDVRDLKLGVIRDPNPGDRHHALVQGKKTQSRKRRLALGAKWLKKPSPE